MSEFREEARRMKKAGLLFLIVLLLWPWPADLRADDTDLFMRAVPPDALILLDMSGSMNWDPAGNPASPPNRRIDIARRALFDLLDDNDDTIIDESDEKTLKVRLGYMRFRGATNNDDGDPMNGSIKVLHPIGGSFKHIWRKISDPLETASSGTPLAAALVEAKNYIREKVNKEDPAVACRDKTVILITDGSDTYACGGNGQDDEVRNPGMYKRRILTVQRAKELNAVGIKVFVVGFGEGLPDRLKTTLNWTAKQGGTDNPLEENSGNPVGYDPGSSGAACDAPPAADPANATLRGYAFLPESAAQLSQTLKTILGYIQERAYCFATPTVSSVRLVDGDTVYLSSFEPNETPFWPGSLKAYRLRSDGTLPVGEDGQLPNPLWEAFTGPPALRTILTHRGQSSLFGFTYENLNEVDLDVGSSTERERLIHHVRGIDAYDMNHNGNVTEAREWLLGDIFHSSAVVVGAPSASYEDLGFSGPGGFHDRHKGRTKIILVGANDGMLHAFDAATGQELWAYVPGSLHKSLKTMVSVHSYYVDSSPRVADVWFSRGPRDRDKSPEEWRTVLISGLRKGGKTYFALDITNTASPFFLWEFPKVSDAATLDKVGESWSEPSLGRVKVEEGGELVERWVAFVGGGFDKTEGLGEARVGRAFFVIDLKTGDVLWEYSSDRGQEEGNQMRHSFPAPPKAVDLDFDGYVDRVYIGDLGGQLWVFNVSHDGVTKKSNSLWTGRRLFKAPKEPAEKLPIYTAPAVALDPGGTPWVFFGTGDRENPLEKNSRDRFYAVKDDDQETYPRGEKDLTDATSTNSYDQDPSKKGWYLRLERSEKVLAKPTVFNRRVYFTTYTYTDPDPCDVRGFGRVYIVEYLSGGGATIFSDARYAEGRTSDRFIEVGRGVPSAPVVTVGDTGIASVIIGTTLGETFSREVARLPRQNEILYWREVVR